MNDPQTAKHTEVFRPRTAKWFTGIACGLVAVGLISSVTSYGPAGIAGSWPLLTFAYLAWWLFWYPRIEIGPDAVTLRNPLQVLRVPWPALIDVDTRYAMKLVTPRGRYTAWAAPAPGIIATHRGKATDVEGLPSISYGPGRSVRPGDLLNTDSGSAAYLVRTRWEAKVTSGEIDVDATESAVVAKRTNWLHISAMMLLVAAGLGSAAILF